MGTAGTAGNTVRALDPRDETAQAGGDIGEPRQRWFDVRTASLAALLVIRQTPGYHERSGLAGARGGALA